MSGGLLVVIIIVVVAVIIIALLSFLSRAYVKPVVRAQNALAVVNYLDAYRVAIRQGIPHEQALSNAQASANLNQQQLKDMGRFIDMNRAALAATNSRDEIAEMVMGTTANKEAL
jgi:hypothetical protein